MEILLTLAWQQMTSALQAQVILHHRKLSDISTQHTRLIIHVQTTLDNFYFLDRNSTFEVEIIWHYLKQRLR